jgi:hypothetical protein
MSTEHKWRRALEKAGVVFLDKDNNGGQVYGSKNSRTCV